MGKWESELRRAAERSAENKESIDRQMEAAQKAVDAAQKFVSVHGKSAPKVAKASAEILEAEADCVEIAGELMILEEAFEKAKKNKNDDEMKTIAAQMKPLISKFESGRKDMHTAADAAVKAYGEMAKEAADLKSILA